MKMKKMVAVLLCMVLAGALSACGEKKESVPNETAVETQDVAGEETGALMGGSAGVRIPNPWTECASLEEAAKLAGFSIDAPEAPEGYAGRVIQVLKNEMIEVIFQNGDEMISVRKAAGSDDVSGDYNAYAEVKTVAVGELQVTEKGEDGKIMLAIWTNGAYSYAVSFPGVTAEAAEAVIAQVK